MRKLARTVARNKSYIKSGTTDMFAYFFDEIWREKGHPKRSMLINPTKKKRFGRRIP